MKNTSNLPKIKWVKEKDDLLIKLVEEGKSCLDLAIIFQCSVAAIDARKGKLKIRKKYRFPHTSKLDPKFVEEFKNLFFNNASFKAISETLSLSIDEVSTVIKRLGLIRKSDFDGIAKGYTVSNPSLRKYSDELLSSIRDMLENKKFTKKIISLKAELPIETIEYICRQYGFKNPKGNRSWCEEEDCLLINMLDNNIDIDEISKILIRSDVSIIARCEKLKITQNHKKILERKNENKNKRLTLEQMLKQKIEFGKGRCQKMGWSFDIDLEYMLKIYQKQNGLCFYSSEQLSWKPNHKNVLSIDRIDSNKGYIKDNVVLCIWDINRMKQEFEINRFIEVCGIVAKNNHLNPQIEYFL